MRCWGWRPARRRACRACCIYLAIYLVTNAGVFVVIMAMKRDGEMVETISDLAGLSRTEPRLAFVMAALMISLAGIPPLAGFWAKFYVFLAAIEAHLYALSVIGVLSSVVGAYYYWRIVKVMYFDEPARGLRPRHEPRPTARSWRARACSRCSSSSAGRR